MRTIATLIIVALIGWCAWWFVGSQGQATAWKLWFDDRKTAGWVAEASDIEVNGFPNRFDTTLTDMQLADPVSGWAWSAPFFQILMLSYRPNHVIAVWPETQKISGLGDTATAKTDNMRGSIVFVPNTDLTLDRTQIEIQNLNLKSDDWSAGLQSANFATRRLEEGDAPDFAHQIGFDAKNLTLSDRLKSQLDPAGILPATMENAKLDLTVAFDAPWDRHSIEGTKPQPTAISVKGINATWGRLNLNVNGRLDVDAQGYPVGELKLKARNWHEMLAVASGSGIVDRDIAEAVKSGLNLLAILSGDKNTLNVPLTFSRGLMKIGPVALGRAPRLIIR